jgi:hypothetical protein
VGKRSATWLAWSLFGLYVLTVAAAFWIVFFGRGIRDDQLVLLAIGYAAVGALVASREPANAIGWLLLAIAVSFGISNLGYAYARDPGLPGAVAAGWFSGWMYFAPICMATTMLPLMFPTGRLPSPRWRIALAVALAGLFLSMAGTAFAEGNLDLESPTPIPNPLGVGAPLGSVVTAVSLIGGALVLAGVALGAASLVVRLRRSRGRERQQLKVVAYVGVAILIDACAFVTIAALADRSSAPGWVEAAAENVWLPSLLLVSLGPPLAIGVAILRHRLYGIDVVIHRTLVYGALTVTLAMSYLGLVLLFQLVLSPVTSDSDVAIAGSTLAVAALFRPARKRIQSIVDRRFYRARYDASRTLEAFSSQLNDELDLDTLAADLRAVVQDTLQPVHVSLWLRETGPVIDHRRAGGSPSSATG